MPQRSSSHSLSQLHGRHTSRVCWLLVGGGEQDTSPASLPSVSHLIPLKTLSPRGQQCHRQSTPGRSPAATGYRRGALHFRKEIEHTDQHLCTSCTDLKTRAVPFHSHRSLGDLCSSRQLTVAIAARLTLLILHHQHQHGDDGGGTLTSISHFVTQESSNRSTD